MRVEDEQHFRRQSDFHEVGDLMRKPNEKILIKEEIDSDFEEEKSISDKRNQATQPFLLRPKSTEKDVLLGPELYKPLEPDGVPSEVDEGQRSGSFHTAH